MILFNLATVKQQYSNIIEQWATPLRHRCVPCLHLCRPEQKKPADVSPFSPAANPHKIYQSAKKSQVVTFCPKNGSRDLGFLGIMRHSWATSCPVEAPPKSYVTHRADRNPTKQTFYKLLSRISLELGPTGRSVIHVFIVSASEQLLFQVCDMISVYMYRKLNIKVYRNILIYILDFCLILWLRSSVCLCGSDQQLKEIIQEYVLKVLDLP